MAIYHLSATIIQRSRGRTATAAAAYRSGGRIRDERSGVIHDYTRRKGVHGSEIRVPAHAPEWARRRDVLWNQVELSERRRDAQLAREINVALPRELSHARNKALLREFVDRCFVEPWGMVADVAYHDMDSGNPHAHVMLTMRRLDRGGFGPKMRVLNDVKHLRGWREAWAAAVNTALAAEGRSTRVDHRSLAEQGIDAVPTVHEGPTWTALNRAHPDTPLARRDRRTQANAVVRAMNRRVRAPLNPARAARAAADHYERRVAVWHRANRVRDVERIAMRPVPSVDRLVEGRVGYVRRRTRIEQAERFLREAVVRMQGVAEVLPDVRDPRRRIATDEAQQVMVDARAAVEALRVEARAWTDAMRRRMAPVVASARARQQSALSAIREVAHWRTQALQWRVLVEDSIPASRDRRPRPM